MATSTLSDISVTRTCRVCERTLPLDRFGSHKGLALGRQYDCKDCVNKKTRARYANRTDDWFVRPTEKRCTRCGQLKPVQEFQSSRSNRTAYSSHCKLCHDAYRKFLHTTRQTSRGRRGWGRIKASATKRGLEFDLCPDEYAAWWDSETTCHYCGVTAEQFVEYRDFILKADSLPRFREAFANPCHAQINDLSIDRRDPTGGYVLSNLAKACWICNYVKGGILTEQQMLLIAPLLRTEIESAYNRTRPYRHGNKLA